ncbi:Cytoplasmic phosphatidylinositol transfer protein 1 [Triplophysa tibetana]|uniref:Cytoplasmic phosphatidylinositol transfer protein 1 n=1 Tax=Triplophysa tibetana TaxID=1572043 RepID=A0A5A9N3L3_9TELE|nr:Cytoplasmic phosphatidylinositol transfer protein 1 [Triplophysa tibetana]
MLVKEYRICMPLTVDEYKIGQLYMISKHSNEQSGGGEGVEVVRNEPCTDPKHGAGQITEKRIYLNRLQVKIETHFLNDNGCSENVFDGKPTPKDSVCFLDILSDPIPDRHYKESEDLSHWVSEKTGRGPLVDCWRNSSKPIMCSYKKVNCSFEIYGFQGRTEEFIHRNIRDILLVGHRQAVAWIDEWHGMTLEEVRQYEKKLQEETNSKLNTDVNGTDSSPSLPLPSFTRSISVTDESSLKKMGVKTLDISDTSSEPSSLKNTVRLNSTPE